MNDIFSRFSFIPVYRNEKKLYEENMVTQTITYSPQMLMHRGCGRSMLARSDTAGTAIRFAPPPRLTQFRPPRQYLMNRHISRMMGSGTMDRWCTPSVLGRTTLARSDTASTMAAVLPRSVLIRPPREDLANPFTTVIWKLVEGSRWWTQSTSGRVTLARSDTAKIVHQSWLVLTALPDSVLIRPPREDKALSCCPSGIEPWTKGRWCTPPIRVDKSAAVLLNAGMYCRGSSPPIRKRGSMSVVDDSYLFRHWSTPPIRGGMQFPFDVEKAYFRHGSSPPIRSGTGMFVYKMLGSSVPI